MFYAPNPGILAAGVSTAKTYAEWQTRLAAIATNGAFPWAFTTGDKIEGKFRTTVGAFAGTMLGTPWMSETVSGGALARAVQHCLPSSAEVIAQAGLEVYLEMTNPGPVTGFVGINRNGYESVSTAEEAGSRRVIDFKFWTPGGVFSMNPFAGTGPTPYDW